ncbi:MAG: DUF177 domain-containing protein [Pseudomonadota bacterium]
MRKFYSVRIDDIPHEGFHLETQWDIPSVDEILDDTSQAFRICSPLALKIFFSPEGARIIVNGECRVQLEITCARCLIAFSLPLEVQFRYIFWPKSSESDEEEKELHQDDVEVVYYEGDLIDLRPIVSEQIYLMIPQYPHCKEDCRGLCPHCGKNLNEKSCTCVVRGNSKENSPFSVLKKLKKG